MYSSWQGLDARQLFGHSRRLDEIVPSRAEEVGDALFHWGDIFSPMIRGSLVHTSTVLLTRERLERVGGFDPTLVLAGEDYDFHLRTCRAGPVAFADVPTIRYQVGLDDRLTRPELAAVRARNFLKAVQRVLASDRPRILLSDAEIRRVLAEGYEWLGFAALEHRSMPEARSALAASLRNRPLQPRVAGHLALALLPEPVNRAMLRAYRTLRDMLAPRTGGRDERSRNESEP
jgi:hypothetical protein